MDPISAIGVAGTAVQLAQEAGTVLLALYRYFVDVKEAGLQAARLREEIGIAISQLHAISASLNSEPSSQGSNFQIYGWRSPDSATLLKQSMSVLSPNPFGDSKS